MRDAVERLNNVLGGLAPKTAMVLGSGLGGLVEEVEGAVRIPYAELPGFPRSGVTGHAGQVVAGHLAGDARADAGRPRALLRAWRCRRSCGRRWKYWPASASRS